MTPKKVAINEEAPVKNWQLEVAQAQIDSHERLITSIDNKLETILNEIRIRPTNEQVDAKLEVVRVQLKEEIKNAIEKQDLKYSPIVGTNKWLLGLLLTSGIGLFGSLVFIAIGLSK